MYHWNGMNNDIGQYVKSCPACQTTTDFKTVSNELHPIAVVSPWYHIGMDLIKMPTSKHGNKHILSIDDYFTKWPEAVAIPDKNAETIASTLFDIFLRMGFPAVYSSDQGREFVNSVLELLVEKSKAAHRISSAYHPQTNGLTERFNRTLKDTLIKVCNENQDNWDDFIDEALFAYRAGKQKSTQETPFEIMYDRPPVHVMDSEIPIPSQEEDEARAIQHLSNLRQNILNSTKENIEKSQSQQKKRYKKLHKGKLPYLSPGDQVLRFNCQKASRKGSKLEKKWLGPYIIKSIS